MSELKKTPIFNEYEKYGAKIVDFGGYSMPIQFTQIMEEHHIVRDACGLFDVSHMGEVMVEGTDALAYLNYMLTNDINVLQPKKMLYSFMCNERGGVIDDFLVYCMGENKYCLVTNASNTSKVVAWMQAHVSGFEVEVRDDSNLIGQLAIQGPLSEAILQKYTDFDLQTIENMSFEEDVMVAGKKTLVSRSGYTGEDGFEIYCCAEDVAYLWNKLLETDEKGMQAVKPIGLGARDTLRFEAAMPLYGNELGEDIPATETGINFALKLQKNCDFIGKEALIKAKENPVRKLVGFELLGKGVPRHGYEIEVDGKVVGVVTTGYIPPTVNKPIGMAYVDVAYGDIGQPINILIRNKAVPAKIISKRFYQRTSR